jgi:hypothetical protein
LDEARVEPLPASKPELDGLRELARRCLQDASLPLSADNRFGITYNAARALATMAVRAARYRVRQRGGAHYSTLLALKAAMGPRIQEMADYLNLCRGKRNELSYEAANVVTDGEADELLKKTRQLQALVEGWIATHYPELKT